MYYKITKNGQITNKKIKIRQDSHIFRATLSSRKVLELKKYIQEMLSQGFNTQTVYELFFFVFAAGRQFTTQLKEQTIWLYFQVIRLIRKEPQVFEDHP